MPNRTATSAPRAPRPWPTVATPVGGPTPGTGRVTPSRGTAAGGSVPGGVGDNERGRAALAWRGGPATVVDVRAGGVATSAGAGVLGVRLRSVEVNARAAADLAAEISSLAAGELELPAQRRVLALLREAPSAVLNEVLAAIPLGRVIDGMSQWFVGRDHKEQLLRLLCSERLPELTVATRALVIGALQTGSTSHDEELAIRDVFLGTRGADLTELKTAIDLGRDHHDLVQLVFHDIDTEAVKDAIVAHVKDAAPAPTGELKVLSDIDDTFYANWLDTRYPKKTVYPGVAAFYRALDQGPSGTGAEGDLVFLTARPGDRLGVMEGLTHETLDQHAVPARAVLTGDLTGVLGNAEIARRKVENFVRHHQLFPEHRYVFVGDSGQGDAIAAHAMRAEHGARATATFIHDVKNTSAAARAEHAKAGVWFFDTYVGAATRAYQLGLISKHGMLEVARAARRELLAIPFATDAQRAARAAELGRDLMAMNALVMPAERIG